MYEIEAVMQVRDEEAGGSGTTDWSKQLDVQPESATAGTIGHACHRACHRACHQASHVGDCKVAVDVGVGGGLGLKLSMSTGPGGTKLSESCF